MIKNYKFRYRLVRHEWDFNVNECLQAEVNCVISNLVTNDFGLDVDIKNINQEHHLLMTELYINSLDLYCSRFKLSAEKLICNINMKFEYL